MIIYLGEIRAVKSMLIIDFRLAFQVIRLIFFSEKVKYILLQILAFNGKFLSIFRRIEIFLESILKWKSWTILLQIILDTFHLQISRRILWWIFTISNIEFKFWISSRIHFSCIESIWSEIFIQWKIQSFIMVILILMMIWFALFTHLHCGIFIIFKRLI